MSADWYASRMTGGREVLYPVAGLHPALNSGGDAQPHAPNDRVPTNHRGMVCKVRWPEEVDV
jgi:hypothetical protein